MCLLTLSFLSILTACNDSGSIRKVDPSVDTTNIEPAPRSTVLTQADLKLLGDADSAEINTYFSLSENQSSVAGLSSGFTKIFGNIGDLSSQFSGISSCATTSSDIMTNQISVNCPGVVGSVASTLNIATFTSVQTLNLEVTGSQGHATLKHTYNFSIFNPVSTRTIKDLIAANETDFSFDGSSQFSRGADSALSISATYQVSKNSGVVETITVTSEGLKSGTCGLNSGTVTYATSSGLSYTVTFAACPAVETPALPPAFPIITPPVFPIGLPPGTIIPGGIPPVENPPIEEIPPADIG